VSSHLLLEKTTTGDGRSKTSGLCPDSQRRAIVIIIYFYVL